MSTVTEELFARIERLPEETQREILTIVMSLRSTLPPSTLVTELTPYVGILGDALGKEISEIIETECERLPEE